jgi:hypothetical protein
MSLPAKEVDQINEILKSLAAEGLIRDSGRRRNGRIVWVITELGKQMAEQLAMLGEFSRRNLNS